jgi:type IV pilus assembly protein PilC
MPYLNDEEHKFDYVAVAADQTRTKGRMLARSVGEVREELRAAGLYPVDVTPAKTGFWKQDLFASKENRPLKLNAGQQAAWAQQFYTLIRSGVSQSKALTVIGEGSADPRFTRMCNDLADRVTSGQTLSVAMEDHPGCFDPVFRACVSAGEATGDMEDALRRLARTLGKQHKLRLSVKKVTAYPKAVSLAIGALVWVILTFIVPRFAKIYSDLGQDLPLPTRIMLNLSSTLSPIHVEFSTSPPFITDLTPGSHTLLTAPINFLSPILWAVVGVFAARRWKAAHADDLAALARIERVKWRMPLLGELSRKAALLRWASTMGGALGSGLQQYAALDLAAAASGSPNISLATEGLRDAVRSGRRLSDGLGDHPELFPPDIRTMVATGDEAGASAEMFERVAEALEDDVDAIVGTLGPKLEVALIVVMGAVVGAMVITLYLPIINLSKAVGDSNNPGG